METRKKIEVVAAVILQDGKLFATQRGYSRNGKDDVNGTYVEVDLTNQHLWFYKNSQLIVETDIVTGKPSYQETAQGAFPIAYKASPFNLKGGGSNGTKSWD